MTAGVHTRFDNKHVSRLKIIASGSLVSALKRRFVPFHHTHTFYISLYYYYAGSRDDEERASDGEMIKKYIIFRGRSSEWRKSVVKTARHRGRDGRGSTAQRSSELIPSGGVRRRALSIARVNEHIVLDVAATATEIHGLSRPRL